MRRLAQEDVGELLVKAVLDHRVAVGKEKLKKAYEFQLGFEAGSMEWIEYTGCRDQGLLSEYVKDKPALKRFVE